MVTPETEAPGAQSEMTPYQNTSLAVAGRGEAFSSTLLWKVRTSAPLTSTATTSPAEYIPKSSAYELHSEHEMWCGSRATPKSGSELGL